MPLIHANSGNTLTLSLTVTLTLKLLQLTNSGKPPQYVTSDPGQLSLLPSAGREMSTGQSAVTLCGWAVKAGIVHSTYVGGR